MEDNLRIFACDLIQNAGILLRLPQVAMATAQMLLQRACRKTNHGFDTFATDVTAMAALFLGAKIEECPRRASQLIDVFTHVISTKLRVNLTLSYAQHEIIRNDLVAAERLFLKSLGFNLLSDYPHKIIINYYFAIVNRLDPEHNVWRDNDNQQVIQKAWNYCNDSMRTDAFMTRSKEAVACACIQMACEDANMRFPRSSDGREWYGLFNDDASEVEESMKIIQDLYKRKPLEARNFKAFMKLLQV